MMPLCEWCQRPIVEYGGIWRHADAFDYVVWCGCNLDHRVAPKDRQATYTPQKEASPPRPGA